MMLKPVDLLTVEEAYQYLSAGGDMDLIVYKPVDKILEDIVNNLVDNLTPVEEFLCELRLMDHVAQRRAGDLVVWTASERVQ